jgi:hypothetical protein
MFCLWLHTLFFFRKCARFAQLGSQSGRAQ